MDQNLLKWINFRKTRDAARNRGSILIGMIFLEMAYLQLYADSRCFSLPCLLLCQFEKTFTLQNLTFEGKVDQNLLIFAKFWENRCWCLNKGSILMGMTFLEMA